MHHLILPGYILFMNVVTFSLFQADKANAVQGLARVPEKGLLAFALFGGWPAAKLAQRIFRHKTRKEPFRSHLNRIPLIWLGFIMFFGLMSWSHTLKGELFKPDIAPEQWLKENRQTPRFFQSVSD